MFWMWGLLQAKAHDLDQGRPKAHAGTEAMWAAAERRSCWQEGSIQAMLDGGFSRIQMPPLPGRVGGVAHRKFEGRPFRYSGLLHAGGPPGASLRME